MIARELSFHSYLDAGVPHTVYRYDELHESTEHLVRERDVSYRFYLHQHPYVQQLTQRLVRSGTAGLQAADTEYAPEYESLPGSIEIAVDSPMRMTILAGSDIALLVDVETAVDGTPMNLEAGLIFELAADVSVTIENRLTLTLLKGMTGTPSSGMPLETTPDSQAILNGTQIFMLNAQADLRLYDGQMASIPAGNRALAVAGTRVSLPDPVEATISKSKRKPVLYEDFFADQYDPSPSMVQFPYPVKDLDFTSSGAYSVYNWELFYHVPLTIGIHLSKNQRFADAQNWLHHIFDPTDNSEGPTPERFWRIRPFQYTDVRKIEEILTNLATGGDENLRRDTANSLSNWAENPFRPHVVARYRQQAYMYKAVIAYLDNLIAWGDSLFRQDTGEAIDEAMMLYVLAASILGPRPQPVPKKGSVRPQTYANLRNDLRQFGVVMREVEADLAIDLLPFPADDRDNSAQLSTLRSLGIAPYFCVPRNDKLLGYWDTVADRLFKIRNSLNLQGIFRQLALFEPPIDPAMLARATAAGLDVGAIINGLNQPLPLVRFQLLIQKAAELAQEAKSLGNSLLASIEKEDAEAIALLRAKHERTLLEMVEDVRYAQLQESIKSEEGLYQTLALAIQRYSYYEQQLGTSNEDIEKAIPELDALDGEGLDSMKFTQEEPDIVLRELEVDIAQDLGTSGGKIVSSHEAREIRDLEESRDLSDEAAIKEKVAAGLSMLPELGVDFHYWGIGGNLSFGGSALSRGMSFWASFARTGAEKKTFEAGNASRIGSFDRREQDWAFQSNLAAGEISQTFRQIRAAQIRVAIAELELKNHQQQMTHAEEIEHFLNEEGQHNKGKTANRALYTWMRRETRGLYSRYFQFAFDTARRAERALQHETGNPDLSYLQFDYLAGKEGLLAGEKLFFDIKRMEMAFYDLNRREYELTKHVSLLQVDPLALVQLRTTGQCTVQLPEMLFDIDAPGHYFRRIRSVALSIPCVTGPYASVNCTLSLVKSSIRTTPVLRDDTYLRESTEDNRFDDYFGNIEAVVTSSTQNDSGMFETNLRDERYLPFENSGVISEWRLQLPADPSQANGSSFPAQFDYDTISDVVFHIRYSARDGGEILREGAKDAVVSLLRDSQAAGTVRLFSVRHEFPSEWARFLSQEPSQSQRFEFSLDLEPEHYPFWSRDRLGGSPHVELLARSPENTITIFAEAEDSENDSSSTTDQDALTKDQRMGGLLRGTLKNGVPDTPAGKLRVFLSTKSISEMWLAVQWGN